MSQVDDFKRKLKKFLSDNHVGSYVVAANVAGETIVVGEGEDKDLAFFAFQVNSQVADQIKNW